MSNNGTHELVTVQTSVKRLRVSSMGNPAWEVRTPVGAYRTPANAQVGYKVTTRENVRVRLVLDARSRLVDVEYL